MLICKPRQRNVRSLHGLRGRGTGWADHDRRDRDTDRVDRVRRRSGSPSSRPRAGDDHRTYGQPELRYVELFEAGVEPENTASRRCLEAAGFHLRSEQPDYEGMLYYRARRAEIEQDARLSL